MQYARKMASKSQRWVVDSGILRKKGEEEEPQELLVFGYSCKLFRDDERAKLIDQGKHLIPWMGDNTLKIDRYDARGALGDLRMYEPPPGGIDYRTILTEEEYKIEQLCDEERYKSLYNNDAEESMYHEEEIKRLHQALDSENSYSQVGFNYDDEKKNEENSLSPKQSEGSQEDDEAYIPDPELEVPEDMIVPDTQKLDAIIKKTAVFISHQGGQMEILIKAKQANNPQFSFLSLEGELYPYYKHILEATKSGKYNPEKQPEKEETELTEESEDDDEPYLHPSLASSLKVEAAPSIPSINYKPSADCAYSMLVNKITGKPPALQGQQQHLQQQHHQQQHQQQQHHQQQQQPEIIPPPPMPPISFYHPMQGFSPFQAPPQQYAHGPVLYSANGSTPQTPAAQVPPVPAQPNNSVHTPQKEPTPLVPYGPTPPKPLSRPSFIVPPADIQIIIDKMASYVAKNGRDFESIVKSKGDPRFNFLELSHQYHGYYAHKLTIYEGGVNPRVLTEEELLQKQELQEEKQKKLEELQKKQQRMEEVQKRVKMIQAKKKGDVNMRQSPSKQVTTVSFSIKKPKEGESNVIEKRNALPLEESDDENSEEKKETSSKPNSPTIVIPTPPAPEKDSNLVKVEKVDKVEKESACSDRRAAEKKPAVDKKPAKSTTSVGAKVNDIVDLTDDIFEDCQKEVRERQENKMKNKILAAAREKLVASKEKQLQMERRKKAAMFLSQIQTAVAKPEAPTAKNEASKARQQPTSVRSQVPAPRPQVSAVRSQVPTARPQVSSAARNQTPVVRPQTTATRHEEPVVRYEIPTATAIREAPSVPTYPSPYRADIEIEELRMTTHSLMSKLRADLNNKRPRRSRSRSRSRSGSVSYSEKHKNHKKHKKKKSSHKSAYRESVSSSRSHKTKKSKKSSSRHRSRSRSPYRHHTSSRHRKESSSSDSSSSSS